MKGKANAPVLQRPMPGKRHAAPPRFGMHAAVLDRGLP